MRSKEDRVLFLLIAIDQLSKILVINSGFPVVLNKGIAFSLLSGIHPILIGAILVVLARSYRNNFWFRFIISGGIANFIDRVRLGHVVDFISIGFFPVFNLADIFITIGVLGVLYEQFAKSYFRR